MAFDPILGVGREPQARQAISTFRIKEDDVGLASNNNFPGTTETLALTPQTRVFQVQVSIFATSSAAVGIDSARFRIRCDQYVVADYKLPNTGGWANNIEEVIPTDIFVTPGMQLTVEYGPELADATGYNIGFSVTAYAITS